MKTMELNRRQFLKTTGALVVSFNLFPPSSDLFGQSSPAASGEPDPTQLDSWIAVSQDGTVTIFTSKVELGTGIETALAQIAAEELDVSVATRSKSTWAIRRRPSTRRRHPAVGRSSGPDLKSAKRPPRPARNSCAWRRKDSARLPRSSPCETEW